MSVQVEIAGAFRSYFDGKKKVTAEGRTVSECLRYLADKYPSTKKMFVDPEGNLQKHFEVYLNGLSTYKTGGVTPVNDGDKIDLIYIVHGG